ncbi:MAG: TonB-dependent receptor, partial [Proteobacteria bacterium]|nr:TonB-dependent receptor [Pseudomonadota bacterium]
VVQAGVKGSQTSVFIRGSNSDHVLVIIDGIEMNDPSSPNGAFDFANFLLEDIASIEVVRGAQSVLYGADALGGVIQIRTRKGSGDLKLKARAEVGFNSTHHESLSLSGSTGQLSYGASVGLLKTDGESIATEKRLAPGSDIENDGYDNKVFSAQLGWQASTNLEANLTARYIETDVDIDGGFDWSGNTVEDPDAQNKSEQLYLGLEVKSKLFNGLWQPTLHLTRADIDRENRNARQDPFGTLDETDFSGEKDKISLQNDLYFFDNQLISVGFEYKDEEMKSSGFTDFGGFIIEQKTNADRQTKSVYIQDQITLNEQLFVTLGARYDNPDDFDSETTYRATANYDLNDNARLTASYGTGFKAPSLFQLYGFTPNNFFSAYYGNPDLKPETSKGWEIGAEHVLWNDSVKASITYYESDIEDLITTVFLPSFDSTAINRDEVEINGVETTVNIAASSKIDINLNHTFTRTKDENDDQLLRRPKQKASFDVAFRATDKMTLTSSLLYTGSRYDVDGFGSRIKMGGYSVLNLAANYQINSQIRVFTRIDNFTSKDYEPAYGFQAIGLAGYLGFELVNR